MASKQSWTFYHPLSLLLSGVGTYGLYIASVPVTIYPLSIMIYTTKHNQ